MRRIHAAHNTACRVLLEKTFPKVFCQVWSLLFSIMPSRCIAVGCSNTTNDSVSLHRFPSDPKYRHIWTTKVKLTRAKWSGPTEHSFLYTSSRHALNGAFTASSVWPSIRLCCYQMQFQLTSKKAVKAPTKKRVGVFLSEKDSG